LSPNTPHHAAGYRIEPPRSFAWAIETSPAATAAADPPLEDDRHNPYAPIGYAISTLVCTPSSLAGRSGRPRDHGRARPDAPFNLVFEARG
jgi:hypothetical protein